MLLHTHTALRGLRAASVFLTQVPLGGFPYTDGEWRWASAWFPAIGLAHGAIIAGVWWLLLPAGPWPAAAAAVAIGLLVTGAFHEDGLADTADALGGGYTRTRVLEILKDSRIGSFGASALILVLLLRIACLAGLGEAAGAALVVCGGLSRVAPVWLMRALPYVTADPAARSRLVARAGAAQTVVATLTAGLAVAVVVWCGAWTPSEGLAVLTITAVVAAVCGWRFVRRVGGLTGDFLGATQQLAEVTTLLTLLWLRGAGVS